MEHTAVFVLKSNLLPPSSSRVRATPTFKQVKIISVYLQSAHLIAFIAPSAIPITFKQKLRNQEVVEEGSLTLRCELSKAGVPVEWRKEAQLLREGEKYQMRQEGRAAEMTIRGVTLADGGEYSCSVGMAATSAEIKVRGKSMVL